jgi:hypothetical protein
MHLRQYQLLDRFRQHPPDGARLGAETHPARLVIAIALAIGLARECHCRELLK